MCVFCLCNIELFSHYKDRLSSSVGKWTKKGFNGTFFCYYREIPLK